MESLDIISLLQEFTSSPQLVIISTAGGRFIHSCLVSSGLSSYLLDYYLPYNKVCSDLLYSHTRDISINCNINYSSPSSYCSLDYCKYLAKEGYIRGSIIKSRQKYSESSTDEKYTLIGIACTASLASVATKRGFHRVYLCAYTKENIFSFSLKFDSTSTRSIEDNIVSLLFYFALKTILEYSISPSNLHNNIMPILSSYNITTNFEEKDSLHSVSLEQKTNEILFSYSSFFSQLNITSNDSLTSLYNNFISSNNEYLIIRLVSIHNFIIEYSTTAPISGNVIISGSFNPFHYGHLSLAKASSKKVHQLPVIFDLSIVNADKGTISNEDFISRIQSIFSFYKNYHTVYSFPSEWTIMLSKSSPLFYQKAQLFPHCFFAVGYDTANRLLMKKYYENDEIKMFLILESILKNDCCFIVAGRFDENTNLFYTLKDLPYNNINISTLFIGLNEEEFRADISSTLIRQNKASIVQ